jgi:hypothetical protein
MADLVRLVADPSGAGRRTQDLRDAAEDARATIAKAKQDRLDADSAIADAWLTHEKKPEAETEKLDQAKAQHDREMADRERNVSGREQHAAELEAKANRLHEEATTMHRELKSKLEAVRKAAE